MTSKGVQRGGRPFDRNSLWNLLTNPVYAGRVKYKDEVHPGEHAAIIDVSVWERVQRMLRSGGRTGGNPVGNRHRALLNGLLHCGPCDRPMTGDGEPQWSEPDTVKGWAAKFRCHSNTMSSYFHGGQVRAKPFGRRWSVDLRDVPATPSDSQKRRRDRR